MGFAEEKLESLRGGEACLMGVLNTTPDSFYDGGRYLDPTHAVERVDRLIAEGATIVDIGGESSRPGSTPVADEEQVERVGAALDHAVKSQRAIVSIDTTSAVVANHALERGARIVNDVSCLADPELARVTAKHRAILIVMHCRGPMAAMRGFSDYPANGYRDVVTDVLVEWRAARDRAVDAGMRREDVWLDPGLGFGKNASHSFELLARLDELTHEGVPVVVGPSRKSFLAAVDDAPPAERLGGTIAACLHAIMRGATVLHVHDVAQVRQALAVANRAAECSRLEAPLAG